MSNSDSPLARTADLETVAFDGETVIYDRRNDKAHCLNETASLVWKNCDGKTAADDIGKNLARTLGAAAPDDLVSLAIADLSRAGLLEPTIGAERRRGPSRREVIRKTAGMTTVALPLIASILAPSAAAAATACSCVTPGDCVVQTSCPSTVNCNGSGVCAP